MILNTSEFHLLFAFNHCTKKIVINIFIVCHLFIPLNKKYFGVEGKYSNNMIICLIFFKNPYLWQWNTIFSTWYYLMYYKYQYSFIFIKGLKYLAYLSLNRTKIQIFLESLFTPYIYPHISQPARKFKHKFQWNWTCEERRVNIWIKTRWAYGFT